MKRITIFLFTISISVTTLAQVPQGIPYQAVARNAQGLPLGNDNITVRFSIIDSIATGTIVYRETHSTTTNNLGLFALNVGEGTPTSGIFSNINWGVDAKFLKVEIDTTATNTSYIEIGIQQMLSVPFALFAKNSECWLAIEDTGYTRKWIGLNTKSPQAPLHVYSGPNGDASVKMRNGFGTSKVLHIIEEQNSSGHYGIFIGASDYSDAVFVTKAGLAGIKTINPQRPLHINDVMRLEPRNSAPSSPSKGDIYFDDTLNKLRVYDGTTWQNCW